VDTDAMGTPPRFGRCAMMKSRWPAVRRIPSQVERRVAEIERLGDVRVPESADASDAILEQHLELGPRLVVRQVTATSFWNPREPFCRAAD